jgi:hypothetical protein
VDEHERPPHFGVKLSALHALGYMSLHAHQLDPRKGVVYEGAMKISEL